MNNLEIYDDFEILLKTTYPGIDLDKREEHLMRMAINHACLILNQQYKEKIKEYHENE